MAIFVLGHVNSFQSHPPGDPSSLAQFIDPSHSPFSVPRGAHLSPLPPPHTPEPGFQGTPGPCRGVWGERGAGGGGGGRLPYG